MHTPEQALKILHLCSYFVTSPLYGRLVAELDRRSLVQEVYIPTWTPRLIGRFQVEDLVRARFHYVHAYRWLDRLTTRRKVRKAHTQLMATVDLGAIDVVHAHSLFINGGVALQLKRDRGLEYVVAARGTDLTLFFDHAPHLRSFGRKILDEARTVVLINPAYRDRLLGHLDPGPPRQRIEKKICLIPNGIEDFWFENRPAAPSHDRTCLRLLYVGKILRGKNIHAAMRAVEELDRRGPKVHFSIVGSGPHEASVDRRARRRPDLFSRVPWVKNREELLRFYRNAQIFIMPSVPETFGLVYLEAMSQGLSVIHARGHGIDGYFSDGQMTRAVDPRDPRGIADAIESLAQQPPDNFDRCAAAVRSFSWQAVATAYEQLYAGQDPGRTWGSARTRS